MKFDRILEFSQRSSLKLSKDIEQIFTLLTKVEGLPEQLVGLIEIDEEGEEERNHAALIALASGVAAFCLYQLFFALGIKILRLNGMQEKSINELLSIANDLEETEKT